MTRNGEAHETLSLVFHLDGVPPRMIFDGSKEQTTADFKRKLQEADCHGRQTEPYSPWHQAAEGCIRELKRGTSRKMIKTGSPKTLWDHCLELEALTRSSTSVGWLPDDGLEQCRGHGKGRGDFVGHHRDSLGGMKKSTSGDKSYLLDL
jgi:hypothetical protein